ncbi:hypothetical protein M3Y95_01112100 [Aphelenchoides besseyi]|nr:hypothetical protein M3Y95_01112100 [Aphelenchoides besseyi]
MAFGGNVKLCQNLTVIALVLCVCQFVFLSLMYVAHCRMPMHERGRIAPSSNKQFQRFVGEVAELGKKQPVKSQIVPNRPLAKPPQELKVPDDPTQNEGWRKNDKGSSFIDNLKRNRSHVYHYITEKDGKYEHLNHRITFPDEKQSHLYEIDYSLSHPFENSCRFPILMKDEPDLMHEVKHHVTIDCLPSNETILVEQMHNGDLIAYPALRSIADDDYRCFYQELSGAIQPDYKNFTLIKDLYEVPLNRRFNVELDQFMIECKNKTTNETIFRDAFLNIADKPRLNPPRIDTTLNVSVSILVLDSTSRNQFYRHAPLTLKFLKEQGFLILNGYNKVNDNSEVNLTPLLAGKTHYVERFGNRYVLRPDMELTARQIKFDFWENADMLVKLMKERGCATLFNDDVYDPRLGMYSHGPLKGFRTAPADYYFRPYYLFLYKKHRPDGMCVNGKLNQPRFLNIWERFATKFARHCHFGFSFLTGLTHDDSNRLGVIDETLHNSLIRLKHNGGFDNTVMILMGDHGQRVSDIQKTYSGRIEERQPFFAIRFPDKWAEANPEKVRQYEININRLVSNYDLHETLREILNMNPPERKPVGLSLFHEIPKKRDCYDSRVVFQQCACLEPVSSNLVPKNIQFRMNAHLTDYVHTTRPSLMCVKSLQLGTPNVYQPYTLNTLARNGIREPQMLKKLGLEVVGKYNSSNHEIFDVEFDVPLSIQLAPKDVKNARQQDLKFQLRTRVLYNRLTNYTRLIAKPWLMSEYTKCQKVFILDDICECLSTD